MVSAVTLSPTVRAKYPSSQNSPPHSSLFTSGCSLNITLALMLFNIPTTLAMLYLGGKDIKYVHGLPLFPWCQSQTHDLRLSPQIPSSLSPEYPLSEPTPCTSESIPNDTSYHIPYDWFSSTPCTIYITFQCLVSLLSAGVLFLPVYKTGHPSPMGVKPDQVRMWRAKKRAHDVVFLFIQK